MTEVFLSYARESREPARALAQDLGTLGYHVWFDQELAGGQAWWDQVLTKIRGCDIFLLALAPESLDSQACKLEYGYASQLGKNILPVLIADNVSMDLLPPALAQIHYADYRTQDKQAILALLRALNALPPTRPLPEPMPHPPPAPLSYLGTLGEQIASANVLSFQEQTALLVRLRQGLREKKGAASVIVLLKQFRAREDLFARVADELDELLSKPAEPVKEALRPTPSAAAAGAYLAAQADSDGGRTSVAPPKLDESYRGERRVAQRPIEKSAAKFVSPGSSSAPERGSLWGQILSVLVGIVFGVLLPTAALQSLNYSLRSLPMVIGLSMVCGLVPVVGFQLWRLRRAGYTVLAHRWAKFVPIAWIAGIAAGVFLVYGGAFGWDGPLVTGPLAAALVGLILSFRALGK